VNHRGFWWTLVFWRVGFPAKWEYLFVRARHDHDWASASCENAPVFVGTQFRNANLIAV
jgi:hypothetical protein